MVDSLYQDTFRVDQEPGNFRLPLVSKGTDSVRAYQFEVRFDIKSADVSNQNVQELTLAAKTVSPIGMTAEDIVVKRLNDKIYHPGQINTEPVTITFDSLYLQRTAGVLWTWFRSIYDPMTGIVTGGENGSRSSATDRTYKAKKLTILELDNTKTPISAIELYGVYPRSVKFSEKNYSTNEFSTIEVEFRFDYMHYFNYV